MNTQRSKRNSRRQGGGGSDANSQGKGNSGSGNSAGGNNNNSNNSNNNSNNNNSGSNSSGGNNSGGGAGGRQNDKGRSNNRRRKGSRKKKVDPRVFWGDPEQLAELGSERATITANPSAAVQSLGRPPLSGQQNAAEHYFVAVYDRAVNLAAALAAAGDLIDHDELDRDS